MPICAMTGDREVKKMAIGETNRKKEDQIFSWGGCQYKKIKPFTFQIFLRQNGCDDYDSILISFAKKFGLERDISPQELLEFLEQDTGDDLAESLEWLENQGFIREVSPDQSFPFGTKFWDRKKEVILILCDDDFSLLDLKTFKCPYGSSDTTSLKIKLREENYMNF